MDIDASADGSDVFFSSMASPRQVAVANSVPHSWLRLVELMEEETNFNEHDPALTSDLSLLMLEGLIEIDNPGDFTRAIMWLREKMRDAPDANADKWVWVATKLSEFNVADTSRWDASVDAVIHDLHAEVLNRRDGLVVRSSDDLRSSFWGQVAGLVRQTTQVLLRPPQSSLSDDGDATTECSGSDAARPSALRASDLVSSFVSRLFAANEEKFLCQICHEQVPATTASVKLTNCGHRFCVSCLDDYLTFNIQEGETSLVCFYDASTADEIIGPCKAPILDTEVRRLVDDDTWTKLERFKFNKQHKDARQCPYCDHSQVFENGEEVRACRCEACDRVFCFGHSSAHIGETCSAFERRQKKPDKLNMAMIDKLCKACPGCGSLIEKIDGCNQMKCTSCKTSFCWLCREVIEDTTFPDHFQWWNLKGCAGSQMMVTTPDSSCERGCNVFFRMLFFAVIGPPAFVLAVAFSLLCCCCFPCTVICGVGYRKAFTTCVWMSGYLILSPLILAMLIICLPCVYMGWTEENARSANTTQTTQTTKQSPESRKPQSST